MSVPLREGVVIFFRAKQPFHIADRTPARHRKVNAVKASPRTATILLARRIGVAENNLISLALQGEHALASLGIVARAVHQRVAVELRNTVDAARMSVIELQMCPDISLARG